MPGAGLVTDTEPNNAPLTAQSIDGRWSLNADVEIGDATNTNTSTTIPHVTVAGTGDGTADYFSFTVGAAGKKGIFDIDFGTVGGVPLDSLITLYDSNGFVLATNNDSLLAVLDPGSTDVEDSFLQYTFAWPPGRMLPGFVGFGSTGGAHRDKLQPARVAGERRDHRQRRRRPPPRSPAKAARLAI